MAIEPSQARYRSAVAFQRLSNALGIQLLPTDEDCVCLERLATQAERLAHGSDGVSFDWVLSQLGGLSFSGAGEAYDYMLSLRPIGREEMPDERTEGDVRSGVE